MPRSKHTGLLDISDRVPLIFTRVSAHCRAILFSFLKYVTNRIFPRHIPFGGSFAFDKSLRNGVIRRVSIAFLCLCILFNLDTKRAFHNTCYLIIGIDIIFLVFWKVAASKPLRQRVIVDEFGWNHYEWLTLICLVYHFPKDK